MYFLKLVVKVLMSYTGNCCDGHSSSVPCYVVNKWDLSHMYHISMKYENDKNIAMNIE